MSLPAGHGMRRCAHGAARGLLDEIAGGVVVRGVVVVHVGVVGFEPEAHGADCPVVGAARRDGLVGERGEVR